MILYKKMIKPFSLPSNHSLNFVKGWPEDKQDSLASSRALSCNCKHETFRFGVSNFKGPKKYILQSYISRKGGENAPKHSDLVINSINHR